MERTDRNHDRSGNVNRDALESANTRSSGSPVLHVREVSVSARNVRILNRVSFAVNPGEVFGILGPSGAGKSTLLRTINRLIELQPGFRVSGEIVYRGQQVLGRGVDADALRARIGIVFQQPVVFPASIQENVLFGVRRVKRVPRSQRAEIVERSMREAHIWGELRDRLRESARNLSVGQRQRLCLARALAMDPEMLLMDEPTSALDARSGAAIAELILHIRETRPVILVTHNIEQARRVTDRIACLCVRKGTGEILEQGCCDAVFGNPECRALFERMDEEDTEA
jgi:phosphate transport system ATP-binding protein